MSCRHCYTFQRDLRFDGLHKPATRRKESDGQHSKKDTFVVAIPAYPGFAIPFIAEKDGLFKDQKVVLKRIDDPAVINSGMIKGEEIDGSFTSTDSFVLAASQGSKCKGNSHLPTDLTELMASVVEKEWQYK